MAVDATEPETLSEAVAWQPDRFVPPLVIDLHEYFTRVTGVSSVHGYTSPRLEGNGPPQAVHGRATWCTRRAPLRPSAVDQLLAGSLSSGSNRTPSRC